MDSRIQSEWSKLGKGWRIGVVATGIILTLSLIPAPPEGATTPKPQPKVTVTVTAPPVTETVPPETVTVTPETTPAPSTTETTVRVPDVDLPKIRRHRKRRKRHFHW